MSSQIQITGETKVKSLTGVLVGTSGVVSSLNIDGSLGIPQLDVNGKIIVSQLPNSVMEYKGTWDASTNTPTLANGTGNQGDVYLCNVAGTVNFGAGAIAFVVSDQVIYSGSIWQKASGSNGTVTSVAVTESGDSLNITGSPITTSGTINIGFNGTNLQYVNGAGNLTTFPILTGYVTAVSGTAPVVSSGGTTPAISMAAATGSVDGYLSATDFAIFSAKQSALAFSSPLINTSGTISIPAATTSVNGYLASADFTTFNNKQNAITLTTTGTSGVATFVGATLNIPNYGSALTGYVPYTGATQDVDLGAFKLNAQSLHAKGTAGNGHLGLKHQSASATASANEVSLFADSLGDLSWQNANLYLSKFITSANTANRSYTFPNANGTVALTSDLSNYVDLSTAQTIGGTKTFSDATKNNGGIFLQNASSSSLAGYMNIGGLTNGVKFTSGGGISNTFTLPSATGYTFTFPNATGTLALTSDISYPVTSVFGRTGAVVATSGDYTTAQVTEVTNLYFTDSRARLALSGSTGISYNNTTGVITNSAPDQVVALTASTGISVTGTYPNFTITNTSPSSGGTVTSVAALTIGTSGTDLSSSVANSTTTPVITLNVPTASATNRGALSSADWSSFNSKQGTITLTTTGTSGAATFTSNTLNIPNYTITNAVTGTGTTNYLPKFTGASTIGNSAFYDGGGFGGFNSTGLGSRTFVINAANARPLVLEMIEYANVHAVYVRPNNSSYNLISSNYISGGVYLPLALSGRENNTDLVLTTSGNVEIGNSAVANLYKLDVNGTGRFSGNLNIGGGIAMSGTSVAGTYLDARVQSAVTGNMVGYEVRMVALSPSSGSYTVANMYGIKTNTPVVQPNVTVTNSYGIYIGRTDDPSSGGVVTNKYALVTEATAGNVGIGTATPSEKLTIEGAVIRLQGGVGVTPFAIANNNSDGFRIYDYTAAATRFSIASTGAATFSDSIGTTALNMNNMSALGSISGGSIYLPSTAIINFRSSTGATSYGSIAADTSSNLIFNNNVGIGMTPDVNLQVKAISGNNTTFRIGPSGSGFELNQDNGGYTVCTIKNIYGSTSASAELALKSGFLTFYSGTSLTERMRIASGGEVLIANSSGTHVTGYGTNRLVVNGGIYATSSIAAVVAADIDMLAFVNTGATYSKACVVASMTATGGTGSYFFYGQQSTSTAAIKIFSNGNIQNTNNSYGAISDARLKENIKDATPKLDDLMKVKVRNYNLKGESNKQLGVISQELEAIFPNMIEESTNMGENMKIKGVKYSVFVPMLIKAVQELKAEIEILKNK